MRWNNVARAVLVPPLLMVCTFVTPAEDLRPVHKKKYAMGTVFEIVVYDPSPERASAAIDVALQEVKRLDHVMSNYDPQSDLSRLNRSGHYHPVAVPRDLYSVIQEALRYSALSDGKFDITVGPLVDAWKSAMQTGVPPSRVEQDRLRSCVGYGKIRLIPPNRINLRSECAGIDLGAIGKGYAVDRAAQVLRLQGMQSALIDAGGSTIYGLGTPPGRSGWPVRLRDPSGQLGPEVILRDNSVSTSEQSPRSVLTGAPFGHLIDTTTGSPATTWLAVSVVAKTAVASDALSTTLLLMGPTEGQRLAAKLPEVAALWVSKAGEHQIASTGPRIAIRTLANAGQ